MKLRAQPLEEPEARVVVLVVLEHAAVVELLKQAQIVRRVLGRIARFTGRSDTTRSRRARLRKRRKDLVRGDAGALQPLPVLADPGAALRKLVRAAPEQRPALPQ